MGKGTLVLDCKRHRLDYGKLLSPPDGYELDRAVATTYSADLGTLLSIPVALVYAQTLEGDLTGARFQLLEAIKRFSRQVKVYHQMGQLHVPAKLNWLHAHLEDALVPVLPDDAFTAFHPKLWVIRYSAVDDESDAPVRYRVIVLSRNLTFDRSWDVAAFLEGTPGSEPQPTNEPLLDFVRWLDQQDPIQDLEPFLDELSRVEFPSQEPYDFHAFHPMGIPKYREAPYLNRKAKKALVLSPFLHEETLRKLRENVDYRLHIFSRRHELEKVPTELLGKARFYYLDEQIVEGEHREGAEDGDVDIQKQDLHAKLFMLGNPGECSWFLGSANATKAAATRNIEFMIELKTSVSRARIARTLIELTGEKGDDGPFTRFNPDQGGKDDPDEARKQALARRFEYALLKSPKSARVEQSANGTNFDLHLSIDLKGVVSPSEVVLKVQPFSERSRFKPVHLTAGEICECRFENLAEVELSRFIHFRIESKGGELQHEFLLRIDIEGLPADRLENILRKIINSSDKFFDYLRFLLADEISKEDLLATVSEINPPKGSADMGEGWHFHLPIYEQLLVTASRSPRKLADVDEIIRYLATDDSDAVIPKEFLSFWEAFRSLIPEPQPKK
ncbi:MAG: phospholipase D family protein [Luteolibacter sp.]